MTRIYLLLAVLTLSFFGQAQDTTKLLSEVVITANKYPQKQSQTGKVITVIDSAMLQQMSGRTVSEILNTVSGTTVIGANNPLGSNQTISIRGAAAGNVLLLIDGIPVNDPSVIFNYFDLNFLNKDQIERIEILKGGQSTLYGSDAVAGVVNIITKKPAHQPFAVTEQLSASSYGTYKATTGINGTVKKVGYQLQHTYITSNGFSSAYDSTGNKNFDKDGYKQNTFNGNMRIALTDALTLKMFGLYSTYHTDLDYGAFVDDKDFTAQNKNTQGGLGLTWKRPNGNWQLNYQYNYVNRSYVDDSTDRANPGSYYSNSTYIGRTHFAELYRNIKWDNWELLAGADFRYNNTDQTYFSYSSFGGFTTYLPDSLAHIGQLSPYASVVYHYQALNVELGGRWNYHSTYGNNFTYTFNPSYLINNKVKLFANISSAFKTPSLYQLFDPYSGNINLQPEKSTIWEGGAEYYTANHFKLRVNAFHRNTKNAIQYITVDPANYTGGYYNAKEEKNYGAEIEATYKSDKWNIMANYTLTNGKVTSNYSESGDALSKDTTYNNLYRVPKHMANVFAAYHITPKFSVSTLLRYMGKRWEPVYAAAPKPMDDYYTIDVSGNYQLNRQLRFFADFKNITNQTYFDVLGYTTCKFNFMAGLALQLP